MTTKVNVGMVKSKRTYMLIAAIPVLYGLLWLVFHDTPAPYVQWDIPTDPFEKQAYDFAHSIKLPDSVPKPVPFNFCKLNVLGLCFGKATSEEYFDHLCKTEAGEYVFKTAKDVEGLYLMRPKRGSTDQASGDRYGPEDPTDFYANSLGYTVSLDNLGGKYIAPEYNHYRFVDVHYKKWETGVQQVLHVFRDTKSSRRKVYAFWLRKWFPSVVAIRPIARSEAEYGVSWRGIRRERDREFGVAGAEVLVLRRETNEVMAVRRIFVRNQKPAGINWSMGISCPRVFEQTTNAIFIPSVLAPIEEDIHGDDHE